MAKKGMMSQIALVVAILIGVSRPPGPTNVSLSGGSSGSSTGRARVSLASFLPPVCLFFRPLPIVNEKEPLTVHSSRKEDEKGRWTERHHRHSAMRRSTLCPRRSRTPSTTPQAVCCTPYRSPGHILHRPLRPHAPQPHHQASFCSPLHNHNSRNFSLHHHHSHNQDRECGCVQQPWTRAASVCATSHPPPHHPPPHRPSRRSQASCRCSVPRGSGAHSLRVHHRRCSVHATQALLRATWLLSHTC